MNQKKTYRPDIDGLRALAVLAIILFHFKVSGFPGGFIGVDIFFVISGYLITGIIISEIAQGSFSAVTFWGRRIRRILPALVTVLIATAVASYFILILPSDFSAFGRTLMAQSLFISNWLFMGLSPYFSAPAETMPLLHTWSLAVEEQFYLFLPLCLILLFRFTKGQASRGLVLIGIALLSFIYGVYLVNSNPTEQFTINFLPHIWGSATNSSAGFYLIVPRIWELLVGSIIAIYMFEIKNRAIAEMTALVGIGAIFAGILLLSDTTPFPGVAALLPVLGTAAIIVANTSHHTITKAMLSFPAMVWIGLISYSLYLWHWPILVLARYYANSINESLSSLHEFLLIILISVLSILTYRYIEQPFRKKNFLAERWEIYLTGAVGLVVVFCIGLIIVNQHGFPQRLSPGALLIADAMEDYSPRRDECFTKSTLRTSPIDTPCLIGVQDPSHIDFVLWGDSHANATMPAFEENGLVTNQTGIFFGTTACAPLLSNPPITTNEVCIQEIQRAVSYIKQDTSLEVFIVAEWQNGYTFVESQRGFYLSTILSNTIAQLPQEPLVEDQ